MRVKAVGGETRNSNKIVCFECDRRYEEEANPMGDEYDEGWYIMKITKEWKAWPYAPKKATLYLCPICLKDYRAIAHFNEHLSEYFKIRAMEINRDIKQKIDFVP